MVGIFRAKPLRPRVKTPLGTFTFDETGWMTDPNCTPVFQWINSELDLTAVVHAQRLNQQIDRFTDAAIQYAKLRADTTGWDGEGMLSLEAVDITSILNERFGLTFGIESQPDFTVTVEFVAREPNEVWTAD